MIPSPSRRRRLTLAAAPIVLLDAPPAVAAVFLTQAAQTAGAGADQSVLTSEAELIINLNNGVEQGCSGRLVEAGAGIPAAAIA